MTTIPANFMASVAQTYLKLTGRAPRLFEQGTAEILETAYRAATSHRPRAYFETVSSATGGGKTKAAEALINYLVPRPVTFVIKEIREIDEVYCDLRKLLPSHVDVAMWDSVHRKGAARSAVADKQLELGRDIAGQFTMEDAAHAHVVLTTHDQWKQAVHGKADRQFILKRHKQACVVIVDEDPDLEQTYIRQPSHVQALIEVLSDVEREDEARAYGFADMNTVVPALMRTLAAMNEIKVRRQGIALSLPSVIQDSDVKAIESITDEDIRTRVTVLRPDTSKRYETLEELRGTVEFLKACCDGRVFYARDTTPAFHAYSMSVPAQPNTIILDGTADINGMFAASSHVHVLDVDVKSNYAAMKLSYVIPPASYRGKLKPTGIYKNSWSAEPFVKWFIEELLVPSTKAGDDILVYAKQALLAFGLHRHWDESGSEDPYYIEVQGRRVWFCHFGAGRGSNRWKHCNVCFRLSEFYPKKAVMISKAASLTDSKLTDGDLQAMSSGTTQHGLYQTAVNTHLMVHNKQETARTCIRELDDHGNCKAASVYFVDSALGLLQEYQQRLYPGSEPLTVVNLSGDDKSTKDTQRVVDRLLSAQSDSCFTYRELAADCAAAPKVVAQIIQRNWKQLRGAGYRQSTEKAERGSGRGKCLVRS